MLQDKYFKAGQIISVEKSDDKLQILKCLGQGTYGQVYKIKDLQTDEIFAAKADFEQRYLQIEYDNIKMLTSSIQVPNVQGEITSVIYENSNRYLMKMDLLGPDLQHIAENSKKPEEIFNLTAVCNLGKQMVKLIKDVHKQGLLHRDIKPANFCLSKDGSIENLATGLEKIHLIDFGLSKPFLGRHGKHIPHINDKELVGTPRYASKDTHLGFEQARKDDVEVIANTLIFLYKGTLPWESYYEGANKFEKYASIKKKHIETSLQEICDGCPVEFYKFIKYCRELEFDAEPNYKFLIDLLEQCKESNEDCIIWKPIINQDSNIQKESQKEAISNTQSTQEVTKASSNKVISLSARKQIRKQKKLLFKQKIKAYKQIQKKRSQKVERGAYYLRSTASCGIQSNRKCKVPLRFQNIRDYYMQYSAKRQGNFNLGFLE